MGWSISREYLNWATWMLGRDLSNYNTQFTWAKWVTPSRDLIALFQSENDEVRFAESIVYYQTTWSNYYPSNQYPFTYKLRSAFNSIIKFRYADILLLKAEALLMGSNPDLQEAAQIIDQIRERVDLAPLSNSVRNDQQDLLAAMRKERRLELALEGQRWFDLVRWDMVEEVMNAVYAKDSGRRAMVYPFNADSYLLPIPQGVLDQNQKLTQNPGY